MKKVILLIYIVSISLNIYGQKINNDSLQSNALIYPNKSKFNFPDIYDDLSSYKKTIEEMTEDGIKEKSGISILFRNNAGMVVYLLLCVLAIYAIIDLVIYSNNKLQLSNIEKLLLTHLKNKSNNDVDSEDVQNQPKKEKVKRGINLNKKSNWFLLGSSVIGNSHKTNSIPCQDNHAFKKLENNWGIAVVCDGAGSAKHSNIGSKFIANEAVEIMEAFISQKQWLEMDTLPSEKEWELTARQCFDKLRYDLSVIAKYEKFNYKDLACTIILKVFTPKGLLVSHIGDGRAGYLNSKGEWLSSITPHNGEESHHTIFITSNAWQKKDFMMSGVLVPESKIIKDEVIAFTLISDGCEKYCFETGNLNKAKNRFIVKNKPFKGFFNPLIEKIKEMFESKISEGQIKKEFHELLDNRQGFNSESDDKTMIIGFLN